MTQTLQATVLTRLRTETRAQHDAIERSMSLMNDDLSCDEYRQQLEQFYGFYKPLEAQLFGDGSPLAAWLTLRPRCKTPLLEADLRTLAGRATAELPVCLALPALNSVADYFGCMYVLEGATLGGVLISRHIRQQLGLTPVSGGQFFNGYGELTGPMWKEFRDAMSAYAADSDDHDAVVSSARATFETLQHWCEKKNPNGC